LYSIVGQLVLIRLTVFVVGSADTAECVDCLADEGAVESYGEFVKLWALSYNMLISNMYEQDVLQKL